MSKRGSRSSTARTVATPMCLPSSGPLPSGGRCWHAGLRPTPMTKRLGKKKARRSGPSTLAPAGQFDLPTRRDYAGGDPRQHHTVQHETGLAREVRDGPRRKRAALVRDDRTRDVVVDRAVRLDHELDLAREQPGTRVASYEAFAVTTYHLRAIPAGSGLRAAAHREHAGHRQGDCPQNQTTPHVMPASLTPVPPGSGHGSEDHVPPGSLAQPRTLSAMIAAGAVPTPARLRCSRACCGN